MNNWYLLAAIPVFGLLVLVHEFGHFITAKWAGIRVEEFGLGFPPRLVGIRKKDNGRWEVIWLGGNQDSGTDESEQFPTQHTIYSLNWIPIGGFVRMPGEDGSQTDTQGNFDPATFAAKPAWKRFIVLVAGVVMNFLLAIILFAIAYGPGVGQPDFQPVIGKVEAGSPAEKAGLRPGDTILAVNNQPVQYFSEVVSIVGNATDASNNPAANASVPITVSIRHADSATPITTVLQARVHNQVRMGITASGKPILVTVPLWQAPIKGIQQTFTVTGEFIKGITRMITGHSQVQLAGPVGIVKATGQVAENSSSLGWGPILTWTAILSLNLAIVNILPFPALDGGRIVLIAIEVLRGGKRLKPEREGLINFVGFAVLLMLMLIITISDVIHWS